MQLNKMQRTIPINRKTIKLDVIVTGATCKKVNKNKVYRLHNITRIVLLRVVCVLFNTCTRYDIITDTT